MEIKEVIFLATNIVKVALTSLLLTITSRLGFLLALEG